MKLTSTAFDNNGIIPPQFTCDGKDISPSLSWSEPPADTKSLALICDDPDAPGKTWVHWVVYNLPPSTRCLPEAVPEGSKISDGGLQGINDFKKLSYGGPCPPGGTHRYFFKLYALDRMLDLQPGATKAELEVAMKDHIIERGELMGYYSRNR
ncbi:MAG: YbhB/YbcL family Raf kinase inhibitor-like protein [Pleurocapsa sp. MO_192.B19]|nr:YbhB/YbcL family Raf kinase inhibitor-like protein [Pleurocapsa sp. MO_192.B19]